MAPLPTRAILAVGDSFTAAADVAEHDLSNYAEVYKFFSLGG
jgi:hypothetical protein